MKKTRLNVLIAIILIVAIFAVPVLADDTTTQLADKLNDLMNIIKGRYYKDVNVDDLVNGAIKGMFEVLDPHSTYFTQEEYEDFFSNISGEFGGLGIVIEKKDHITVVSPIEGTPAFKAGFRAGDEIIYVDEIDISDYTLEAGVDLMRGDAGTEVRIGVKRRGTENLIYFDIVREIIKINPITYEIKEGNIGYIKITQFNGNVYNKIKLALEEMKASGVKGIVIDVRSNPGGLLSEVVNISKMLIPEGPIVHIDYKNNRETYKSELKEAPYKLAVLVNGGSASASEILAGAVKDSGAGILVGEKTYGKGSVQSVLQLVGGGGLKITTAHYLTPSEFALDGIGLTPDIEVASNNISNLDKEYSPIKGNRSLRYISIGLDVQGLQQRLQKLGYNLRKADGVFRGDTKKAVMSFEEDYNLEVDGVLTIVEQEELEYQFEQFVVNEDPQLERAIEEVIKMIK